MAPFGICELPFETDDKDGNQVNGNTVKHFTEELQWLEQLCNL